MNRDLYGEHAFIASEFTRERAYWLNKLSGDWEKSFFPYDYKRTTQVKKEHKKNIGIVTFQFPPELFSKITRAMNESDSRLHMILTAGLFQLINKYIGNEDIIIGTPINKQDIEGEFVNTTLALRNSLDDQMTFRELLQQTRQTIVEARENQNYPIETLPYELNIPSPDNEDFPLLDVAILLENIQDKHYLGHIPLNMIFSFSRTQNALEGVVDYNTSLFHKTTIERITRHYIYLLQESLANPDLKMTNISLLSELERKQLVIDFNNTIVDYPHEKKIHELFQQQAEKTPDNTAILEAEGGGKITYRELDEKTDGLARVIIEKGVKPGSIVPIMGQRTIKIITGIIGILKAGGAYLPIDATSPPDRIQFIIQDSRADIFLTQTHLIDKHRETFQILSPANVIAVDKEIVSRGKAVARCSGSKGKPTDPVYVIYTSGTTGRPKGVVISHQAAVNYITWAAKIYVKKEPVNFPLYSSISFDMTVTSLFTPLITGNAIVLYGGQYSQFLIEKIIEENRVDIIKCTPSHLQLIRDKETDGITKGGIKCLIVGGEELDTQLARDIHNQFDGKIEIFNEYGPTEAAVGCMIYRFDPLKDNRKSVPIGIPADNAKIYLLDKYRNPVPVSVVGEIYIGGDGIAKGYLNHPELTAEKFDQDFQDFQDDQDEKEKAEGYHHSALYRTGDLARWLTDGNIEFLGRIDQQVKIRGYRIEPGEIENRLLHYDGINEALVLPREDHFNGKYLCAYILYDSHRTLNVSALRDYLSQELPDYMIPAFFVQLEEMPLTPNGKINRKALPEPEVKTEAEYIPPRNAMEKKLSVLWAEVLNIEKEKISIDSNFFELGGHSLTATVLASRMHREFDIQVPLVEIFEKHTIKALAKYLEEAEKETFTSINAVEKKDYYALSSAQKRLYIQQQMELEATAYNLYMSLPLKGDPEREKLEETFKKMIRRHESLRTSFELLEEAPVQRIHDNVEFEIEYYEAGPPHTAISPLSHTTIIENFVRPFDLAQAPLLRVGLIKIEEKHYLLMFDIHHIVTDGLSQEVLAKDFITLHSEGVLPPLELQYKDYAEWQNYQLKSSGILQQEKYWLSEFEGEIPSLNLPFDYEIPDIQSFEGDLMTFRLGKDETALLKEMALQEEATLFIVMLALYNIFLSKICNQEIIIVGTPIAGRRHADLEHIIGMFVNVLAVKNNPKVTKTFKEFLGEVKEKTLKAFENQDYQYDELVKKLGGSWKMGKNLLGETYFVWNEMDIGARDVENGSVNQEEETWDTFQIEKSRLDLALVAGETAGEIECEWFYKTKLFKRETIEKFCKYFVNIVKAVQKNPHIELREIELSALTEEDKGRIVTHIQQDKEIFSKFKVEDFNENF